MADDFPYTTVPNRLWEILVKIPTIGRPDKATQGWLKGLGYRSGNDMTALTVMRKVGLVRSDGTPTEFWSALRAKDRGKAAAFVKSAYRELFNVYPDANQKDDEALRNFFRSKTAAGDDAQKLMVRTFKVLCEVGDFSTDDRPVEVADRGEHVNVDKPQASRAERASIALTVNIQLQIPIADNPGVYDGLFAAMAKHLRDLVSPG